MGFELTTSPFTSTYLFILYFLLLGSAHKYHDKYSKICNDKYSKIHNELR